MGAGPPGATRRAARLVRRSRRGERTRLHRRPPGERNQSDAAQATILIGRSRVVAQDERVAYLFRPGMAGKNAGPSGWRSEHVAAAIVGAIAAVLVAAISLLGREGDSEKPDPTISIGDFVFFPQPSGDVRIQVSGTVANFRAGDRLYAVAEPTPIVQQIWWVSQQVAPTLDGTWVAQILAAATPGQELRVYAVRVPNVAADPISVTPPASQSQTPSPTTPPTGPTATADRNPEPTPLERQLRQERLMVVAPTNRPIQGTGFAPCSSQGVRWRSVRRSAPARSPFPVLRRQRQPIMPTTAVEVLHDDGRWYLAQLLGQHRDRGLPHGGGVTEGWRV